jgi:glycosyltransferase involved in cell wall biosynthesis
MSIYLATQLKDSAWGGANQFLKILQQELIAKNEYEKNVAQADVILSNSYQDIRAALKIKFLYPNKKIIHRLGPIFHLHRKKHWKLIDKALIRFVQSLSDGVVFQSEWSLQQAIQLGFNPKSKFTIIGNCTDQKIFFPSSHHSTAYIPTKLLAVSWSKNWNKGFEMYSYLDKHLDFTKYSLTFIGNSPIQFKNITQVAALPSHELAEQLRAHDIYLTAVRDDAYSNSIVEALACGLPVVALQSGANSEIIHDAGTYFTSTSDIIDKIDGVRNHFDSYTSRIKIASSSEIAERYSEFCKNVPARKLLWPRCSVILFYLYFEIIVTIVKLLDIICSYGKKKN